jgi:hypothetical protein
MLILEIALGIILACVAMAVAPLFIVGTLGVVAHVIVAPGRAHGARLSTVLWTAGICIAIFAGVCIEAYKAAP